MLGFAVIDRQPSATQTAVWLTSRIDTARANHTNAVVIDHDDKGYAGKIRSLVVDRVVVLTPGSTAPLEFAHPFGLEVFDGLLDESAAHQQRIAEAVDNARVIVNPDTGRRKKRDLVDPDFPRKTPDLAAAKHDEPAHRALAAANYIAHCWELWLRTDEQRVRRTVKRTDEDVPAIMPPGLDDPALADFPPKFSDVAVPEPLPTKAAS